MQQQYNRNSGRGSSLYPMQLGGNSMMCRNNNNNQPNRRVEKKKVNPFGNKSLKTIDYLDGKSLLRFTNDQGKILPKRITGATAFQQRQITKAIKYARHLALLPFVAQDLS
jgi:small subunit ribosomal protein S18